jgi:hypothetical protein
MKDQRARPSEDDEESLKALSEFLAAGRLLDVIVAHECEGPAIEAENREASDDEVVTGSAQ